VRSQAAQLELPLLLLHGADDPICAPAGSQRFHDGVASGDKTLRIYRGSRHEVHNDVDRRDFERDIVGWIGERIAPATPQPDTVPVRVVDRAFDPQPAAILRGRMASS
jgi:alpha-beta hydrolase superfamily lysophospholipase